MATSFPFPVGAFIIALATFVVAVKGSMGMGVDEDEEEDGSGAMVVGSFAGMVGLCCVAGDGDENERKIDETERNLRDRRSGLDTKYRVSNKFVSKGFCNTLLAIYFHLYVIV